MGLFDNENSYFGQMGDFTRSGISVAVVADMDDPLEQNRVRCRYLTGDDDAGLSDWAPVAAPFGGPGHGIFFLPNMGDVVLLAYEEGDIHMPYVIGSLWRNNGNQNNPPPFNIKKDNLKNADYIISTPKGNKIHLMDEEGKEKIRVATPKALELCINDENNTVSIRDKDGKATLVMDFENGDIMFQCKRKIVMQAGKGAQIELDGETGNITMACDAKLELKAAQIKAEASGTAEMKSHGEMKLESASVAQLKGNLVKLN